MHPPDDGREWIAASGNGLCPTDPHEIIWAILNDGRVGGTEAQQRKGFWAGGWRWGPADSTGHYVAYWTSDPPMAEKGTDFIQMLIDARGE